MDIERTTDKFWNWYERIQQEAPLTDIGKRMTAAGFHVAHTGGNCLAWEKSLGDRYLWICDEGNSLGDSPGEPYLVGFYNNDADVVAEDAAPNLDAALAWCEAREICWRWISRVGMGFHPDTRGASYVERDSRRRCFTDEEAAAYDRDIERLFGLHPDPYAVAVEVMEPRG